MPFCFPFRCFLHRSLVNSVEGASSEDREILDEMDNFTLSMVSTIPGGILEGEVFTDDSLDSKEVDLGWKKSGASFTDWKKARVTSETIKIGRKLRIDILQEDDIFGEVDGVLFRVLRSPVVFPIKDRYVVVSDKQALSIASTVKLNPKGSQPQASPQPYHNWPEMTSDQAISRIFFYGIGSVLTASQPEGAADKYRDLGPFVVDMKLHHLAVRRGYAKYGARVHFDKNQKLTAIFEYGKNRLIKANTDDKAAWERAKHILKQTTITLVTAREHLLWTHMLLSNTVTRVKTEILPPSHPLRRLLTVFTFRTNYVNNNAESTLVSDVPI